MKILPHTVSTHLEGRVLIAAGDMIYDEPYHSTLPIGDGLRILTILNGEMTLKAGDLERQTFTGPTNIAIFSDGLAPRDQRIREKLRYRCVLIQIDRSLVAAESALDPVDLLRRSAGSHQAGPVILNARRADPASEAVAAQILSCPETPSFDFYRLGKALELTSLVLDGFDVDRPAMKPSRLTPSDAERIKAARDILIATPSAPPDIATLASQTGLNTIKLNRGFRMLYGATPYAFLQEHRLQIGYKLLASGHLSVGQVAAETGYTQAHFATLFRKRFGLPPSALLMSAYQENLE
ncbi:AraC family transcriptional regulator [Agaricicola taiwanensis]|uniref:AraC family transcriptional regulator n=1 Tax=Agaricicola taiwanensis TaxID=591372 RepID=A0A8J3E0C5_9RHOB|nr:AraC family transcriptional regulator [Agaricicola taiwanensis]GGE54029.1 AraC family transcriptional regulator [Agaricicola taiwanensis]